jgi:nicotinate-nucleotide adenylyltransferase
MNAQTRKRIAVAGSAANPVTKGHRQFAEVLTHSGQFDRVLWLPSGSRPDKPHLISAAHRVHMTELAFSDKWRKQQPTEFMIDLREAHRESIPTIYLLREFQAEYPDAEIIFTTGVDVLVPREEYGGACDVLHYWDEGAALLNDWTFAVLPRGGYPHPRVLQEEGKLPKHFIVLDRPHTSSAGISSTEIRTRIACGEPIDELVDPAVAAYIHAHGLYR